MIDITKLTKKDVGRWVKYRPAVGEIEEGRIKSWSDRLIFVVYACGGHWEKFTNYTAAATAPSDLSFVKIPAGCECPDCRYFLNNVDDYELGTDYEICEKCGWNNAPDTDDEPWLRTFDD